MQSDSNVKWNRVWWEIDTRIETLARRVREGVEVLSASDFARWLQFSGILEMLEAHEQDLPLPVKGRELRVKVQELVWNCGEWFRLHEHGMKQYDPRIPRCEMERITARLNAIEAALAISPPVADTATADSPALQVLPGGV